MSKSKCDSFKINAGFRDHRNPILNLKIPTRFARYQYPCNSLILTSKILGLNAASTIFRSYSCFKLILGLIPTLIILGLIPASTIFRSYFYFNNGLIPT